VIPTCCNADKTNTKSEKFVFFQKNFGDQVKLPTQSRTMQIIPDGYEMIGKNPENYNFEKWWSWWDR
jgi:hypothetical protein